MSFDLVDIGLKKSAALCRGDRYSSLIELCDKQKTIRTSNLRLLVNILMDDSKVDGVFVKKLVDEIRKLRKQIKLAEK